MKFLAKNQKNLKVRKIRKCDEAKVLFREKIAFLFLEAFFYNNEKAQNMPEVAGRLVYYFSQKRCPAID